MLEDFLRLHPLERSWLDEIADVAASRSEGEVTVAVLVKAQAAPGGRARTERIVRLWLEDFSSGLDDARHPAWDLFFRADAQHYRLRSHPMRPDVLDYVEIRFREPAAQAASERFAQMIESQQPAVRAGANARRRVDAFGRVLGSWPPAASVAQETADPHPARRAGWRSPGARQVAYRP